MAAPKVKTKKGDLVPVNPELLSPEWQAKLLAGEEPVPAPGVHPTSQPAPSFADRMFNTPTPALQGAPMVVPEVAAEEPNLPPQVEQSTPPFAPQVQQDQPPRVLAVNQTVRSGGRGSPYQGAIIKDLEAQGQAGAAQFEAQAAGAEAAGLDYENAQDLLIQNQQKHQAEQEEARKAYQATIARHDAALEQVRNTKIDGGKDFKGADGVVAAIGMLMVGGPQMLMHMMDRSVALQTANLKKQQEYVEGLRISADMKKSMLNQLQNEEGVEANKILEMAKLKLETTMARTNNAVFKSKAAEALAQLQLQQDQIKMKFAQQNAARAVEKQRYFMENPYGGNPLEITQAQAYEQMKNANGGGLSASERLAKERLDFEKSKYDRATSVPGFEGRAYDEGDAKAFRAMVPVYKSALSGLDELIKVSSDTGFMGRAFSSLNPSKKAEVEAVLNNTQLIYKGLDPIKLGALSGGDLSFVRNVIADPLSVLSKKGALKKARSLIQKMYNDQATNIGLRSSTAPSAGVKVGL